MTLEPQKDTTTICWIPRLDIAESPNQVCHAGSTRTRFWASLPGLTPLGIAATVGDEALVCLDSTLAIQPGKGCKGKNRKNHENIFCRWFDSWNQNFHCHVCFSQALLFFNVHLQWGYRYVCFTTYVLRMMAQPFERVITPWRICVFAPRCESSVSNQHSIQYPV